MNDQLTRLLSDTLGLAPGGIGEQTTMANTPEWDSVAHLNVCMAVEAEFGISLMPEEMIEMTSVAAILTVLGKRGPA